MMMENGRAGGCMLEKRNLYMWVPLLIACVGVFVAGEFKSRQEDAKQHQLYLAYLKQQGNPSSADSALTPAPESGNTDKTGGSTSSTQSSDKSQSITVIDWLRKRVQQNGTATIVALGSSGSIGVGVANPDDAWYGMLRKELSQDPELSNVKWVNLGGIGYTTSTVINQGVVQKAIEVKPDIVLLETCAMTDWIRNISVTKTISNLDEMVDQIQSALPDARIILQSANPTANLGKNVLGLTYTDYVNQVAQHIREKGWEYIDVYEKFEEMRVKDGKTLTQVVPDGYHPNKAGYSYWYAAVNDYFHKRP
jgi:lysophospholipase L1-like esterase